MSEDMVGSFISLFGGCCCCFLIIIIAAFVIYKAVSKKKSPVDDPMNFEPVGAPPPPPLKQGGMNTNTVGRFAQYGNLISSVGGDGFYILNEFLTPGSVVHYRYRQGGNWFTRSVPYQPGPQGHFVYLGSAPSDIQVVDVVPPGESPVIDDPARTMITSGMPPRKVERDDPPARTIGTGYPSAY